MTTPTGTSSSPRPPASHVARKHPRFDVEMSAEVRTTGGSFTARTRNLSEGGAGLECDRPLTEGEEVVLGMFLVLDGVEDERFPPLWVKGRIAWCGEGDDGQSHTAGVRFEVITDEQKGWLRRVLEVAQPG